MIKMTKGSITTNVTEKMVSLYEANGWVRHTDKPAPKPDDYAQYTKAQLVEIGKNNNILLKERMTRDEMIERLQKPTVKENKRVFTDNLLKDEG